MKLLSTIYLLFLMSAMACSPSSKVESELNYDFQLAAPQVFIDSVFFKRDARLFVELAHPGTEIYYALNKEAVTQQDIQYEDTLILNRSSVIAIKAFHEDFSASDLVIKKVFKASGLTDQTKILVNPMPGTNYPGRGAKSLVDRRKGTKNFRDGRDWLGFQASEITINVQLEKPQVIETVILSTLMDHGAWIFAPERLELISQGKVVGSSHWEEADKQLPSQFKFLQVKAKQEILVSEFTVKVINHAAIPDWHPGSGSTPWLFVDEILLD